MPEKKIIAATIQVDTGTSNTNIKELNSNLTKTKTTLKETGEVAQKSGKNISDTGTHFSNLKGQISAIPGPAQNLTKGIGGINEAFNLLRANPIILVLTVLAGLIIGLFQKFQKMEGVSDSLGKAFGALSGVFNFFLNKILSPLIEGFSKLIGFITDAATFLIGIFSPAAAEAAKRSGELAEALDDLNDAEAESALRRAESNRKLQEAKELAEDANVPIKDRIVSLKEAGRIEKEELDKSIEIATTRARIMLEQIAIELDAREDLIASIRNGSVEELKAARTEIFNMENVDKEKIAAIDEQIIKAEEQGAARARISKKTEAGITALEKEEAGKRKEQQDKINQDRLKQIAAAKDAERKLYEFNSKLRQLQQDNELSQIKDSYAKELKALENKLANDKAANERAAQTGGLTRQQANLLNDQIQIAADNKRLELTDKHNKEVADKELAFQDKLAKLRQEIMLGGIVDERKLQQAQLKISYENSLEQAKKEFANNADQLAQYTGAIEEKYRQDKAAQDQKFAEEDAKKKLEADKLAFEDKIKAQEEILNDQATDIVNKQAAADAEQLIIQQAFDNKVISEMEYTKAIEVLAKKRMTIAELEAQHRKAQATEVGNVLGKLSDIVGKQTAVGKGLAIAQATINTWTGATEALRQKSVLPSPFDVVAKVINVAAVVASGIKAVQAISAVQVPGGGGGGGGNISAPVAAAAPLTPTLQGTQLPADQINQFGSAVGNRPVQAYVLQAQGADEQEVTARLNRAAKLGGG